MANSAPTCFRNILTYCSYQFVAQKQASVEPKVSAKHAREPRHNMTYFENTGQILA